MSIVDLPQGRVQYRLAGPDDAAGPHVVFVHGLLDADELVEVSTRLQRFTKPVLVLWGDADRFFTMDLARRLQRAFPDARLVEIPGARTFFPLDEPRRVADEIQSALHRGR
jgi:pimeloyl-ACP methyl ester carboxylesterase